MKDSEDEIDTNNTVQEAAPNFSFEKEIKETSMKLKDLKPRKNNGSYPKLEPRYTPGPGTYMSYSTFGSASGGHKKTYMGGTAKNNWDTLNQMGTKKPFGYTHDNARENLSRMSEVPHGTGPPKSPRYAKRGGTAFEKERQ